MALSQTRLILMSCAAALAAVACATQKTASPTTYKVVAENAQVAFADRINGFRVGPDNTIILDGAGRKLYRVTVASHCRSRVPWENAIAFDNGALNRLDRFSFVLIDGQRCAIDAVDEVEAIKPAPDAAPVAPQGGV